MRGSSSRPSGAAAEVPATEPTEAFRRWVLWCGFLVAFSPAVWNMLEHLRANPHDLYITLPFLIGALLLLRGDLVATTEIRPALGVAVLAVGLALEAVGIAAASWTISQAGIPLAVFGLSLLTSVPSLRIAICALALVPVPESVHAMTSPELESIWAQVAARVLEWLGVEVGGGGPLLLYQGERFELDPRDSGLINAILLSQVSWYASIRKRSPVGLSVLRAVGWGVGGLCVQPLLVILSTLFLPMGNPQLGRFLLTYGLWILTSSILLLSVAASRRSPAEATRNRGAAA